MKFNSIDDLKAAGFVGFKKMSELFYDCTMLPKTKGVYLVLNLDEETPEFLTTGTGGHFKGKNPNVAIKELTENLVNDAIVVYIGKAGKDGTKATLQSRLKQYFLFGQGSNVGHRGGRFIWQLKNSSNLVVCWKALPSDDPRTYEAELIRKFIAQYSARPFANLMN